LQVATSVAVAVVVAVVVVVVVMDGETETGIAPLAKIISTLPGRHAVAVKLPNPSKA
jgi:negative regulator of sigma E activity